MPQKVSLRPGISLHLSEVYSNEEEGTMQKYVCNVCGYIYDPAEGDPDNGVEPGTSFESLPEDWVCPMCGALKEDFSPEE